jgi:hypothetical protein
MLDLGHLPRSQIIPRFDVFYAAQSAGTTTDSWQTWSKPRGVSFVYGLIQAAGGGGGRPGTGAVSGGGGGGGGSTNTFILPAYYLPDTLCLRPGKGGAGATTNVTPGGDGTTSYLCTQPNINSESLLVSVVAGLGGAAAATGGTAGAIAVFSNQLTFAVTGTITGNTGAAGGSAGVTGSAATWGASTRGPTTAGGGGGGGASANTTGGQLTVTGGAGVAPFASLSTASASSAPHGHGFNRMLNQFGPRALYGMGFAFTGGPGGGASNGGAGGRGGHGAYGCGGGGGGGGATTGNGGNGGDGLIILLAW